MDSLDAGGDIKMSHSNSVKGEGSAEKIMADLPLSESNTIVPSLRDESPAGGYVEKTEVTQDQGQANVEQDNSGESKPIEVKKELCDEADELRKVDWNGHTEAQLEEFLLIKLDASFKGAIKTMASCCCTEEAIAKAILRVDNLYGDRDTFSNIIENTLNFVKSGQDISKEECFKDLVELEKYMMAEVVSFVLEVSPTLSTGDALWCLLVSDMKVFEACEMAANIINSHSPKEETESQSKTKRKSPKSEIPPGNHGSNKLTFSQCLSGVSIKTSTQSPKMEGKQGSTRKVNSRGTKSESVLHQKSSHVKKSSRSFGPKGSSSRAEKMKGLSGLLSHDDENHDNKSMIIQTPTLDLKSVSLNMSKGIGVDGTEKTQERSSSSSATHKSLSELVTPKEKNNDMLIEMLWSRVRELKSLKQEWSNWGEQKIKEATHQLIQDKMELKNLRQMRDESDGEKEFLEENATNKLVDLRIAVENTNWQVEQADDFINELEKENATIKEEMEGTKKLASESSIRFQDLLKRENDAQMKIQSWEKEKSSYSEELTAEKRKLAKVQQEIKKAQELKEQIEVIWMQEKKAKEEVMRQLDSIRKEREQIQKSAKSEEDRVKMQADKVKQRYLEEMKKYEEEIAQLKHKDEASIIAAMRKGLEGNPSSSGTKNNDTSGVSEMVRNMSGLSLSSGGLKRERECVMCLSEEKNVVFWPCHHQVLCLSCNKLHEKKKMRHCPICMDIIQLRNEVNYDRTISKD